MKWAVFCVIVATLLGSVLIRRSHNNVCKTFEDYYSDRDSNENCYHNPDIDLEVPDMIRRNGYPVEIHNVTTKDGYILTVFRIPHGKNSTNKKPGKPVLVQHGMTLNSASFVNIGHKSLGFVLANAGYDVWLGNFRGAKYSSTHVHLSETDSEFWDFSFHENGIYDLPSHLDLITDITKQKVVYVGYSLAATAAFVYGTVYPDIAREKVEIFISLAPIVYMDNLGFLFQTVGRIWSFVEAPLQLLTNGKLFPKHPMPRPLIKFLCLPFPVQMKLCQFSEMMALGFNYEQNDPETLPVTLLQNSDTTSVKTVSHYCQVGHSGSFQFFDYGVETNKKMYGSDNPLLYNLSNFKVPTYSILAENDYSVNRENVDKLHNMLPKETTRHGVYTVEYDRFNHLGFITAKDVVPLVYDHLVKFIDNL